ncbi:hypothetical protein B0J18DRAFT_445646 [Chaetomium sp. MPI-SDFR-AT-0129]|nr:hypothetical protein B0J18DRAFT_445646 [Chaetomium sp. MPI-SDFR-AT-0129]
MRAAVKGFFKKAGSDGNRRREERAGPAVSQQIYSPPVPTQPQGYGPPHAPAQPAQQLDPELRLFREHGDTYAGQGKYDQAVVMYMAALEKAPGDAELLLSLAVARMMLTPPLLVEALEAVEEVIRRHPQNVHAYITKADICERMVDFDGAEAALLMAVQIAVGMERVRLQQSLASLRSKRAQTQVQQQPPPTSPGMGVSLPGASGTVAPTPTPQLQEAPSRSTGGPANRPVVAPASATASSQASTVNTGANRAPPQPSVVRPYSSSNVNETPARSIPLSPDILDNIPQEAPPSYTTTSGTTTTASFTPAELDRRLDHLEQNLAIRNKGSLSVRPYTLAGGIDAVLLLRVGMTANELTPQELQAPTYLHTVHAQMRVNARDYPSSTFIDQDPETSPSYDGKIAGTVTVLGYSEEYRAHQLRIKPLLNLQMQSDIVLPTISLDRIVARLRLLRASAITEDDKALQEFLGLSQVKQLQYGFHASGTRQRRIDSLFMLLSRSHADEPDRFVDLRNTSAISSLFLTARNNETTRRDFLYCMLLGAELLLRLRKQPLLTSYASIATDYTSALLVTAAAFMQNVQIIDNSFNSSGGSTAPRYAFIAAHHREQSEALMRFAEAIAWPYMDEARDFMETAYTRIVRGEASSLSLCDWLFGLTLPGKLFRHHIMCCLVLASQSAKHHGSAYYYDNGLVVGTKSYWPVRTVLGRVLGGLQNPRAVCGWLGPVPAPTTTDGGAVQGWVFIYADNPNFPVPVTKPANALGDFGFDLDDQQNNNGSITSVPDMVESITNPDEWICPTPPAAPAPANVARTVQFKGIRLEKCPSTGDNTRSYTLSPTGLPPPIKHYAILDFEIAGTAVSYKLYSNPVFVTAPPCVGTHVVHRQQALRYLSSMVTVAQLKEVYVEPGKVLVINAQGKGEEVVARAWCAERRKSAVVRRNLLGQQCCMACACSLASARTGLGIEVVIWSL